MEAVTIFSYKNKQPAIAPPKHSSSYIEQIGKMIKKERKKLKLSQKEFAKKIHSTQKIVSLLEAGKSNPTLVLLERVSSALEKDLVIKFK
jgi:predicted transcriptional regulator